MVDISLIDIVSQVGTLALWLQALGGIVILWIIFQGFGFYYNLRRFKKVESIQEDMKRMEKKLDKLLVKKK